MKTILVPTDFSDNAYHALRYAMHIFQNEACTFYLLHAYVKDTNILNIPLTRPSSIINKTKHHTVEQNLYQVVTKATSADTKPKHIFKVLPIADTLLNAIGKTVLDENVQYIFMGTKGATGLKSVFFGSNTVNVISNITFCPLIAVPSEYKIDTPTEILFATGFEHVYDTYELNPMIKIAKICHSKIQVLHIISSEKQTKTESKARKLIQERLKEVPHGILEIDKTDKISTEIEKIASHNQAIGMVVLINYWHSFLEKLTHESVIKNIAFKTSLPLMVLHLPE